MRERAAPGPVYVRPRPSSIRPGCVGAVEGAKKQAAHRGGRARTCGPPSEDYVTVAGSAASSCILSISSWTGIGYSPVKQPRQKLESVTPTALSRPSRLR